MNIVMGWGLKGFFNILVALLVNMVVMDVVKCFNIMGFNNMKDLGYGEIVLDVFVVGDSVEGKKIVIILVLDVGFVVCYDIGGND